VIIVALAGGGYYVWSKVPRTEGDREVSRMKTAPCETRDIQFSVSAAGDIGPADQVSVRPEVNGRIAELPVDIGDKVAKDALLCRLDDKDLQIERSTRLAEIDGAKVQLTKAQRNFKRTKELFEEDLVAKEIYEDTRTDFELASNTLARADAALRLLEDRLSKTKIQAPLGRRCPARVVLIAARK